MAVVPPAEDPLLTCPYESVHQILKSRFQVHLVRCRKNHKNVKKVTCPFNNSHLLNEPELNWHASVCSDRKSFDNYQYVVDTGLDAGRNKDVAEPVEPYEHTELWGYEPVESYDPQKYTSTAPILRQKIGGPKSERKAFRDAERRRLRELTK